MRGFSLSVSMHNSVVLVAQSGINLKRSLAVPSRLSTSNGDVGVCMQFVKIFSLLGVRCDIARKLNLFFAALALAFFDGESMLIELL